MNAGASGNGLNNDEFEPENKHQEKPIPEWLRKTMIFSLVFWAVQSDPTVKRLFKDEQPSEAEISMYDFSDDVQKMRKDSTKSSAFYHLNKLTEIERPEFKTLDDNTYSVNFALDNEQIDLVMKLDENSKDTISGRLKVGEKEAVKYNAIFSPDSIEEFKVVFADENNRELTLGREYDGSLYKISNGKKVPLNTKNVERYEQYLEDLELLHKYRFFTTENDLWRKLNLILLMYLIINEALHDAALRKKREQENSEDNQENKSV